MNLSHEELATAQKRLSNHGNGTFGKWCKERLGFTSRTAENLIRIYDGVPKKDYETVSKTFDVTALYCLLADTCPEDAYKDALKLANGRAREMYDAAAKERQQMGKESLPYPSKAGQARDAAGKAVGVSGKSVDYAGLPPGSAKNPQRRAATGNRSAVQTSVQYTKKALP